MSEAESEFAEEILKTFNEIFTYIKVQVPSKEE